MGEPRLTLSLPERSFLSQFACTWQEDSASPERRPQATLKENAPSSGGEFSWLVGALSHEIQYQHGYGPELKSKLVYGRGI